MGFLVAIVTLPAGAMAQNAPEPPNGGIRLDIRQRDLPVQKGRRPVVRPVPPLDAAAADAGRVLADLEAERRRREVVRERAGRPPGRPDLGYDVANGIQQRNALKALSR